MSKINMIETYDGWLKLSKKEYEVFKLGEKNGKSEALYECIETLKAEMLKSANANDNYIYGIQVCIEKLKEIVDGNEN